MNAKKLTLVLSVAVLGMTSCGINNGLTRKEAYTKLDEIVAATPTKQTKLTAVNGTTNPAETLITYTFDADAEYSHVLVNGNKSLTISILGTEQKVDLTKGDELFAYKTDTGYTFGAKLAGQGALLTYASSDANYSEVDTAMNGFAQTQIDAFVKCGREHWHNGAGGLSAYLKRQDTLDQNKKEITVDGTVYQAGATENGSYIVLENEKYSSTGAGNLTLDFDALYPNPEAPAKLHEPLLFEFNNNLLTHWYNKKASSYVGNEWTMNYGTADTSVKCSYTSKGAISYSPFMLIISGLVALDQPTAEADLYPAHWSK